MFGALLIYIAAKRWTSRPIRESGGASGAGYADLNVGLPQLRASEKVHFEGFLLFPM
jgi:hypothetical protein